MTGQLERLVAGVGAALAGAVLAVLLLDHLVPAVPGGLTLLLLLLFVAGGPGAGVVCHLRSDDAVRSWSLVVTFSLAISAGGSVLLVWSRLWHPTVLVVLLAALTGASCGARLLRVPALQEQVEP